VVVVGFLCVPLFFLSSYSCLPPFPFSSSLRKNNNNSKEVFERCKRIGAWLMLLTNNKDKKDK
jgi:hypothetical protein